MSLKNTLLPPLAERVRPKILEEFIGQKHLTKKHSLLNKAIFAGNLFSCVLWGPPGTGKTTLAKLIAKNSDFNFYQISAVSSGVKDLRKIITSAKESNLLMKKTLLFIDEIHRFNKAQQDGLLHAIEDGTIVLIGATTENPSFEIISPLLSRCKVMKLNSLHKEDLSSILQNAMNNDIILSKKSINFEEGLKDYLIQVSGGDARKMLNTLEAAVVIAGEKGETLNINEGILSEVLQSKTQLYDKDGDYHYDTISAFIKSVRGSDPDAAIYWLAIMLEGGENPEFIARRLIILASEDIGNADPQALVIANAGFQAVHIIGVPEAAIILAQVTIYLASAVNSNASYLAIKAAKNEIKKKGTSPVPLHLRNATTKLTESLNYGKNYVYPHDQKDAFLEENYFPDKTGPKIFYKPTNRGYEDFISKSLKKLWPKRRN